MSNALHPAPLSRRTFLGALAGSALRASTQPSSKPLRGIFPIVATPFTASKALDWDDLAKEVEWFDRCGAHGIVWPQRASEYDTLSFDERRRGFEVIAQASRGKRPAVVFGVQGPDAKAALQYLDHAEKHSPDAFIAIPPDKAAALEDFRAYYRALAKATRRPIFIQTTGGGSSLKMPVSLVVELAREHPNLGYVKEELEPLVERMKQLCAARPPLTCVMSGSAGKAMLPEMAAGSDGTMPGASYTDVYVQVWDAWQAGDRRQAREIFTRLLPLINLDGLAAQGYQYAMYRRGVFKTPASRHQRPRLTPELAAEFDAAFAALKPYLRA